METTPTTVDIKSATIAVTMLIAGIAGTVFYDTTAAPPVPQTEVRYEKIDDDTYTKYTVNVSQEQFKVSEAKAFIDMLDAKIIEFQNSSEPEDVKRLQYAENLKADKVAELEQMKNIGIPAVDTVLSEIKTQ